MPFGKLLCFDCLVKVGDVELPKIKVSKLFRLLGGTDTEFEKELIKSEKQLSTVNKIRITLNRVSFLVLVLLRVITKSLIL